LHNALDSLGSSPLLFLGGHSASSFAGASPLSALAMAGISSWMSVASSIRDGEGSSSSAEDVSMLLGQLNGYFSTRSFLVPSPAPTLADLDLYLAMISKVSSEEKLEAMLEGEVGGNVHVRRWLEQCAVTLNELHGFAVKNSQYSKIPIPSLPKGLCSKSRPLPVFFYGDDDEVLGSIEVSSSTTRANSAGKKEKGSDGKPKAVELTDEDKKAVAEKRAKKAAGKAKTNDGGAATTAPEVELNISALDIRVGRIVKAWEHESSDKLFCEEVDVGEEKPRLIASGLRAFYKLDEMQNRSVLVLCNLKARSLGGFPSHGMVLCASNDDHTAVEFAVPPEGAKIGERVCFEGFDGQPEAENKVAKKKMFEALAPDLKTDGNGEVVWKGAKGGTSAGVCKAINGMANAHVS
jgi:aminoacyl tRNA synthase complex-interacting multifunctional protein 1